MALYIQEAQERPFDLLKKKILVHPILEPINEDFYGTCLLLIRKNSSCTKEGGHLSYEDLSLVEKRMARVIEETNRRLQDQISSFSFMMRFASGLSLFGFLYALSIDWHTEISPSFLAYSSDLSFLLLGSLNWITSFSYHYWLKRYISSIIEGAISLFLRIMQSVEIQYKKVKNS